MALRVPTIGDLREQVDIVAVVAPYDLDGVGTVDHVVAAKVWAKVEPLGGSVSEETMQVRICAQACNIWIRRRRELTPFMQLRWGGKTLVITGPIEEFGNEWQLIHAEWRQSI